MRGSKLAGGLWIAAGLASAAILPFVLGLPAYAAVFAAGTIGGLALGYLLLRRSSPSLVTWSNLAGIAWLAGYGWITIDSLDAPVEEVISVVVIIVLGLAAAVVTYLRRSSIA